MTTEHGPFRIRAVAELTGIPEPTLRAWERRYGIPTPERTASGYRLYGEREVKQVNEMRRLCEGGLAAAEAARQVLTRKEAAEGPVREGVDPYSATVDALLDAVSRFDPAELDLQLRKALVLGSTTTILDSVFFPLLREMGRRWHLGQLSVAQEHLASQRLSTVMRDLMGLSVGVDARSTVICACFAEEDHELGLLGVAMRLAGWGLRPVFLGARTPPDALRGAVQALAPALVALSVVVAPERARARRLVDAYARACGDVPWLVGGAGAVDMADLVDMSGGVVAPEDAADLRSVVAGLVGSTG